MVALASSSYIEYSECKTATARLVISSGRDKLMEVHDEYGHYQIYAAHGWKFMTHVVYALIWLWYVVVGGTGVLQWAETATFSPPSLLLC